MYIVHRDNKQYMYSKATWLGLIAAKSAKSKPFMYVKCRTTNCTWSIKYTKKSFKFYFL